MSGKTKIIVINRRDLILGITAAVIVIVFAILFILSSSSSNAKPTSQTSVLTNGSSDLDAFLPGVYTSTANVNGNPVEIRVTVDTNNINGIDIVNLSDTVATMYPMLTNSFQEIAAQVMQKGSTENITISSDNKYTASCLLLAIENALDKCSYK